MSGVCDLVMCDPPARKTIDRVTPNYKTDSCVAQWTAVWWLEASACVVCWDDPQYSVELSLWLNSNCSGAFDGSTVLLSGRVTSALPPFIDFEFSGIASLLTWIVELDRRVEVDRNLSNNKAHLLIYFGVVTNKDLVFFLLLWVFFRLWIFYSLCIVSQTYHCMHSSCTGYSRKRHPSLSSSSRFQWRSVTAVSTRLSDFVESPSWLKKTQTIGIKQNKTDRSKRWCCASWSRALRWQRFGL